MSGVRACVCWGGGGGIGPVITQKFTQNENMYSVLTVFDHNMQRIFSIGS